MRVLVVDDNRDVVATMIALLGLRGHDSKACYNGIDALHCVREYDPDVVLLDIGLPGKSGWQVAEEIRASLPGKRPMLIGISGEFVKGADRVLAESKGFDYYLAKPADPKVVLALIEGAQQRGARGDESTR